MRSSVLCSSLKTYVCLSACVAIKSGSSCSIRTTTHCTMVGYGTIYSTGWRISTASSASRGHSWAWVTTDWHTGNTGCQNSGAPSRLSRSSTQKSVSGRARSLSWLAIPSHRLRNVANSHASPFSCGRCCFSWMWLSACSSTWFVVAIVAVSATESW